MTRPTDQLDIASELEESERAYAAAKVRAVLQTQGTDKCQDCGTLKLINQEERRGRNECIKFV